MFLKYLQKKSYILNFQKKDIGKQTTFSNNRTYLCDSKPSEEERRAPDSYVLFRHTATKRSSMKRIKQKVLGLSDELTHPKTKVG